LVDTKEDRMTAPTDRPRAHVERYCEDDDPDRRVCRHYSGGLVYADGEQIGPSNCRAGVPYVNVGINHGTMIKALPCTSEAPMCALREWGPRRSEGRGLFGTATTEDRDGA
jgi:hypothetical protein